jgi:hypothetical protein
VSGTTRVPLRVASPATRQRRGAARGFGASERRWRWQYLKLLSFQMCAAKAPELAGHALAASDQAVTSGQVAKPIFALPNIRRLALEGRGALAAGNLNSGGVIQARKD